LPSLKDVTKMIVLLQVIFSFKLFGQPYLMTGGGPGTSTRPLVQYIYEKGFNQWDAGYASAMSYILLMIMVVVAVLYNKFVYKSKGDVVE
jgi:multiple sugar transport system permease protein